MFIYAFKQLRLIKIAENLLASAIHVVVILLVLAGSYFIYPLTVLEIPKNCLLYAFRKCCFWIPTQVILYFRRVDSVTQVMPETVFHESYQVIINPGNIGLSFRVEFLPFQQHTELRTTFHCAVHNIYYQFNYVDIPLLVVPSYIIYTAVAAVVDNEVDGLAMVFDVKPVAHIKPLSVNRKFFPSSILFIISGMSFSGK